MFRNILKLLFATTFMTACQNQDLTYKTDIEACKAVNRPVSKGWPLWMKHHNNLANGLKDKKIDLLMIGDSIIFRFARAGSPVWKKYYVKRNAYNFGSSGDRTEHILWRLQNSDFSKINPKLVVLLIGTNNTAFRRSEKAEETAQGIEAVTKEIRKRIPSAKILLLGIFPRGNKVEDSLRLRNNKVNSIIKNLADNKKIFYRDFGYVFLNEDNTINKEFIKDTVHPVLEGFEAWAQAMEASIEKLMDDK